MWRGCGQHTLCSVVERFNKAHTGEAHAFLPDLPYAGIMQQVARGISGGHADSFATSIALYLRAPAVRVNQIPEPENKSVDWNDPDLDFARYSSSGVIGDPTHATTELGEGLWRTTVETVALIFREIAKDKAAA